MGMFLAFLGGRLPQAIYQYMVSLQKLTRLVSQTLGFELSLLEKIVANSQLVNQLLLSPQGRDQLVHHLKFRRSSTTELAKRNHSVEFAG